ncbi:MAG: acetyl-CoA carboxylase biotin carboxyl carrier protein subunit [Bacteroidales bacterium]|nr:acetyl-CoA carboxylase biotin carboxyl carrier protein subunit [Bacteroidales bacterium]
MSDQEKDNIESKKPSFKSLVIEDVKYRTLLTKKYQARKPWSPKNENNVLAFIPGTILKIYVQEGKKVKEGERLLILEAMKMKNAIVAPFDAIVKKILVKNGDMVAKNHVLIELEK